MLFDGSLRVLAEFCFIQGSGSRIPPVMFDGEGAALAGGG